VTPNDPGDADTGVNNLQNFPELQRATNGNGSTTVQGSLSSTPGQSFDVHFYASPAADPSGFGEGRRFLGETSVSDGDGDGAIPLTFLTSPALSSGQRVTATATSAGGDTSEFSNAVTVNTPPSATPDAFTTPEDTQLSVPDGDGDVLGNDADADGNAISAALVEGPAQGTLELGADGSFTYTPAADFHGEDAFRYLASDGTDASAPTTVAISVGSVNDLPVITPQAPKAGSRTKDRTPKVKARAADTESDLTKGALRLSIDGERKKGFSYKAASDKLKWTADRLAVGAHKVKLTAEDADGGRAKESWKFKVTG
jgi:VCBS repeat-containing protein